MTSEDVKAVGQGLLGVGVFFVLLGVLFFLAFMGGLMFGIIPIACGAPLEELGPLYAWLSILGSFVASTWGAIRVTKWLAGRSKGPAAQAPSETPPSSTS